MSKRRPQTSLEFCAAFDRACLAKRQRGTSHCIFTMPDGRAIPVPVHNGRNKDLSPGLRCHLLKELVRYGLIAVALAACVLWLL